MDKVSANASVPCMEGGSAEDSYANNSLVQNFNFHTYAKPHLSQALDLLVNNTHFFPQCIHQDAHRVISDDVHALTPYHDQAHQVPHQYDQGPYQYHNHSRESQELNASEKMASPHMGSTLGISSSFQHFALQHHHDNIVHLNVADFGCSYGPNTLDYAAFIVQGLYNRLKNKIKPNMDGTQSPSVDVEMQYFFSDLPRNNFNSLFQTLEPFFQQQQLQCFDEVAPLKLKLFDGAVAGSFHGHLFPTSSLHLAISAYTLHWLSQVPPEVVDRASPSWNGGHIWIHGTRPKVVEAYAHQFQKDTKSFLLNRAKEIAKGGILFLFFPCRYEKHPKGAFFTPQHDIWTGCYESTWEEMVLEGLITKDERDMFNLPFYICHKTEMQEALEELSNEFKVVKMEVMRDCSKLPKEEEQKIKGDPQVFGKFVSTFVASLMKPMVQEYLNESRASDLFQRLQTQATKKACLSTSISYDMLLVIIQRL